jgi:PAS domain S-box-containing protein
MAEPLPRELARYVGLDEADVALLVRLRSLAAPHFPAITAQFYERIREHDDAFAVFRDEAQLARQQRAFEAWLERLLAGKYDDAYYEKTAHIGQVHVRVGLPQRYMFSAMALVRVALMRIAAREGGDDGPKMATAVSKLLDLELAVMLEAYREDFVARVQRAERLEMGRISASLASMDHRYRNAVELASVLVVGLDANGTILLFNREAERCSGWARDEVLGRGLLHTLIPEEARQAYMDRVAAARAGALDPRECVELELLTRSGASRTVCWHFAHVPSEQDDVVIFAIGQDITESKVLAERTRQAEKLAAVGTLAAGLAHEIRNPLNGATLHVAYVERALRKANAGPELLEAVGVVADEIKRLATLVTEFLDFARPKPLALKPTSLRAACERVASLVAEQAAQAHVAVVLDLPQTDVEPMADATRLGQVLLNLVQNAIEAIAGDRREPLGGADASPPSLGDARGHVTLRVRRQGPKALVEVEDDGPGIENPDAPIFDAFYSTKASGTGLGLAITHRIVSDHGGSISVRSRPGQTIFSVVLPMRPPGAAGIEQGPAPG